MTKNRKKRFHSVGERRRAKRIAIMSVLAVLVVACLCFVVGFGISEGWGAVAAWFTSKWATLVVVSVLIAAMALLYAFFSVQDKRDFK